MRESHRKGVANHPDPESCAGRRKVAREALTGAQAGRILSCEINLARGKTRKGNWFTVRRQTVKKRLRRKLQAVRRELRKRWHERVDETGEWLRSVVAAFGNGRPYRD